MDKVISNFKKKILDLRSQHSSWIHLHGQHYYPSLVQFDFWWITNQQDYDSTSGELLINKIQHCQMLRETNLRNQVLYPSLPKKLVGSLSPLAWTSPRSGCTRSCSIRLRTRQTQRFLASLDLHSWRRLLLLLLLLEKLCLLLLLLLLLLKLMTLGMANWALLLHKLRLLLHVQGHLVLTELLRRSQTLLNNSLLLLLLMLLLPLLLEAIWRWSRTSHCLLQPLLLLLR